MNRYHAPLCPASYSFSARCDKTAFVRQGDWCLLPARTQAADVSSLKTRGVCENRQIAVGKSAASQTRADALTPLFVLLWP